MLDSKSNANALVVWVEGVAKRIVPVEAHVRHFTTMRKGRVNGSYRVVPAKTKVRAHSRAAAYA